MMTTKNKIGAFIGVTFSFMFVALGFQNCAQQVDMSSMSIESDQIMPADHPDLLSQKESPMGVEPTDSKQTLESMMSLLGLTAADINKTTVNGEVNLRRGLLASRNDINLVNSPAVIAITSLASVVCEQAYIKEKNGQKDIFKFIDFTKGPKAYGKTGAINTYISMADRFWMRTPTDQELKHFTETMNEYFGGLSEAERNDAAESKNLAIFICTGMLSVPESYLF